MSDPFDARVLRFLVRESAAEDVPVHDWDAVEERLFARLDEAPTSLSRAVDHGLEEDASEDELNTSVRLSELPGEADRPSPEPAVRVVAPQAPRETPSQPRTAARSVVHVPGGKWVADPVDGGAFADGEDVFPHAEDRKSSAAIDSFHSPSLMLDPPKKAGLGLFVEHPRARRLAGIFGALAVAACIALLVGAVVHRASTDPRSATNGATIQEERWVDPSELPLAQGLENVRDANALRQGDVVEATQGSVAFGLRDRLVWTLSPGSRVRIEAPTSAGAGNQVVSLQSGSIHASVGGDPRVNPLVVQAGDAMVSVEGSSLPALFTVTRSSKGLAIEVEQGTTLVGALVGGEVHRLGARERGSLSLDAKEFRLLEPVGVMEPVRTSFTADGQARPLEIVRSATVASEPAPSVPPIRPEPSTQRPTASAEPPAASATASDPPTASPVLSDSGLRGSLVGCIESVMSKQSSQGSVSLSAESTVRFVVDEEGVIRSASFNPPLKPELQACAVPLLRAKVAPGARSIQVPVSVSSR
ncbi:MAG: FecR family protein [Polyangiaceae bacterium]